MSLQGYKENSKAASILAAFQELSAPRSLSCANDVSAWRLRPGGMAPRSSVGLGVCEHLPASHASLKGLVKDENVNRFRDRGHLEHKIKLATKLLGSSYRKIIF